MTINSVVHNLNVNDVLYSSWGYEQTNVDFYQVIKLVGKTMVEIQEINQIREYESDMSGSCSPRVGSFIDAEPLRKKVTTDGISVRLESYSRASKYDGQPKYFSTYG